jgi:hypothetical protein
MGARSFRVRPADDDEFLAIEPFGFTLEAPVSRRIGRIDRVGNDAFESKLTGVLPDKLAIACLVAVELKAGNVRDQRLEKSLAFDQWQAGRLSAAEMQEVESVVDEPNSALAVACRLSLRKASQSIVSDAA